MSATIFEGKGHAQKLLGIQKQRIIENKLRPLAITILIGDDKASELYTKLKVSAADSIGIKLDVARFVEDVDIRQVQDDIRELNQNPKIVGIMIQLPLPREQKKFQEDLVNLIDPQKDVDGMREHSNFTPATVKAILSILKEADVGKDQKIAVVGSRGTVGKSLIKHSELAVHGKFDLGDDLSEMANFDVVISATGKANLIKPEMIGEGSVLIDVGAPKAEFDSACYKKASFYTPVPGGVGPMTIASLMENIVDAETSQR